MTPGELKQTLFNAKDVKLSFSKKIFEWGHYRLNPKTVVLDGVSVDVAAVRSLRDQKEIVLVDDKDRYSFELVGQTN